MKRKPLKVLLIEDDPGDVDLAKSAISIAGVNFDVYVTEDGDKASNFLHKKEPYQNADTPDLVILDFNLPRKNGAEILAELYGDERLRHLPIVVLSTSRVPDDIIKRFNFEKDRCFVKPLRFDDYIETFKKIEALYYNDGCEA